MTKLISVDPAFKRCGVVVLDGYRVVASENIDFVGEEKAKQNQTDYTIGLFKAIKSAVDRLIAEHKPDLFLLENQIGKFACTQVHSLMVSIIDQAGVRVLSQSPRFKLQDHWGLTGYVDSDSNQYNKNKNKSKAIAKHYCEMTKQKVALDRDVSDALLQGLYYQKYVLRAPFEMTAFEETKVEETIPQAVAQATEASAETKPKRKPAERKPREKKPKAQAVLAEAVAEVVAEVVAEAVVDPVPEPTTEKKKSVRKSKPKPVATTPVEVEQNAEAVC